RDRLQSGLSARGVERHDRTCGTYGIHAAHQTRRPGGRLRNRRRSRPSISVSDHAGAFAELRHTVTNEPFTDIRRSPRALVWGQREGALMDIGLVGLGKMGGNMRARLRNAGHTVIGYDHNRDVSDVESLDSLADQLP